MIDDALLIMRGGILQIIQRLILFNRQKCCVYDRTQTLSDSIPQQQLLPFSFVVFSSFGAQAQVQRPLRGQAQPSLP